MLESFKFSDHGHSIFYHPHINSMTLLLLILSLNSPHPPTHTYLHFSDPYSLVGVTIIWFQAQFSVSFLTGLTASSLASTQSTQPKSFLFKTQD